MQIVGSLLAGHVHYCPVASSLAQVNSSNHLAESSDTKVHRLTNILSSTQQRNVDPEAAGAFDAQLCGQFDHKAAPLLQRLFPLWWGPVVQVLRPVETPDGPGN